MTTLALAPSQPDQVVEVVARLETLRHDLAETVAIADGITLINRAEAIAQWVRIAQVRGEVAFEAGEVHVRAQRRLGELLLAIITSDRSRVALPKRSLERFGLTSKQSSRSQLLAKLPLDEFDRRIEAHRQAGRPPTTEAFVRAAARFALPMRKRVTPTSTLLRRAVLAMREIRNLSTAKEIATAREIARIGAGWVARLNEHDRAARAVVERATSCLLCGRSAPRPIPPRCPVCKGAWFST